MNSIELTWTCCTKLGQLPPSTCCLGMCSRRCLLPLYAISICKRELLLFSVFTLTLFYTPISVELGSTVFLSTLGFFTYKILYVWV